MATRRPQWLPTRQDAPGLALAASLGALALGISRALPPSPFMSDVLLALALGALVLNTPLRHVIGLALPSGEREPDRYAPGLRFTGKWVLRLGIILMGLKVQTSFFGRDELLLIAGVAAVALPGAFFVSHALASVFGVRRPMGDILAGGTMICGASAVNAIAPIAGARREEQGVAIGVVFLFSVVAMFTFAPIAALVGLSPLYAGLWSGLAVNDLSSALAVGTQMGGEGGVMAAAAKSARILLLAPTLILLSLLRRDGAPKQGLGTSIVDTLPGFLLGYVALALVRVGLDRLVGPSDLFTRILAADQLLVDFLMTTVSAGIGLHFALRGLLGAGARAVAVGAGASLWMAGLTLTMITLIERGAAGTAGLVGVLGLVVTYFAYRVAAIGEAALRLLRRRLGSGAPLSLAEATQLLAAQEREGAITEPFLRRLLGQLHPTIGELIPVRESPLAHGEGCRWITYWQGASGMALVAVCRDAGSVTPIHAHPHTLLGKTIEGSMEELRFVERGDATLEVAARNVLQHNDIVETDGLATLHLIRAIGGRPAIDLQLRGPELGSPGRRFRTAAPLDLDDLRVGSRVAVREEIDDRPGHAGEGAAVGLAPQPAG